MNENEIRPVWRRSAKGNAYLQTWDRADRSATLTVFPNRFIRGVWCWSLYIDGSGLKYSQQRFDAEEKAKNDGLDVLIERGFLIADNDSDNRVEGEPAEVPSVPSIPPDPWQSYLDGYQRQHQPYVNGRRKAWRW